MAFSPYFSVGQSVTAPSYVVFTDESTGTDAAIVSRRIYVTDSQGNPVVPSGTATDYISWPWATNPLSVLLLEEDTAVNVLVQWLDVNGDVLYDSDENYCLDEFNTQNFIYLIQNQGLTPGVVQDTNYFSNMSLYWVNIIGAQIMVEDADDIAGSQNCLNRATNMLNNQSMYF